MALDDDARPHPRDPADVPPDVPHPPPDDDRIGAEPAGDLREADADATSRDEGRRLLLKRIALGAAAVALVGMVLMASAWWTCSFKGCPDPRSLLAYEPSGAPDVLDRDGESFATLLPVQREVVNIDSLPDHVGDAFIAVEDRRFRSHGGVDLRRMGGALLANVRQGGVAEGGSTITMQLARNAFPERLPASQRTIGRKLAETRVAVKIEDTFDKDQILGLYLNQIYFGNGATGIAAASRHYFGVPAREMKPEQAALMAAMVKAPAHYDPREDTEEALERRNLVLDLMGDGGYLTPEEVEAAKATDLEVVPRKRATDAGEALPAPWFLEAVRRSLDEEVGWDVFGDAKVRVVSTIDPALQAAAEEAFQAQLRRIEAGQFGTYRGAPYDPEQPPDSAGARYLQGAIVVLDARTGDVLAMVGGRNYRHSTFDHVYDARRQIGSAFKPFVYGAAVARGIGPSHVLDDAPLSIEMRGSPTYRPTNYDGSFDGPMPAREALRRSRNVPTVRLAQEVGTDAVADFAREAGMDADIPEGPSMALGTVALSPMELARVYTSFAGLGRAPTPRVILRVEDEGGATLWEASDAEGEERIEARVAYVVNDMLKGVVDGGTGAGARAAGFRGTAAGKTGTTQEAADVWFVGYTPDLVGVVWMGFDQPEPILRNASGGGLAAPVWGRMMSQGGRSGSDWEQPPGVVRLPYDPATGNAMPRDCWAASGAPTDLFLEGETGPVTCPQRGYQPDTLGYSGDSLSLPTPMPGDSLPTLPGRRDTFGTPAPPRPMPTPLPRPTPRDTVRPTPTPTPRDTVRPTPAPRPTPDPTPTPNPTPNPTPTPTPPPTDTLPPPTDTLRVHAPGGPTP